MREHWKEREGNSEKTTDRAGIRGRDEARVGEKRKIRKRQKSNYKRRKKRAKKRIRGSAER